MTKFEKFLLNGSTAGMEESGELIVNPFYKRGDIPSSEIEYAERMSKKVNRWFNLVDNNKEWFGKENQDKIKKEAYDMSMGVI